MKRTGGPSLYVTVDAARDIALVRGRNGWRTVELLVPAELIRRSRDGWVIPLDYVPDIETFAQYYAELCIVTDRKPS